MQPLKDYLEEKFGKQLREYTRLSSWNRARVDLREDRHFVLVKEKSAPNKPLGHYDVVGREMLKPLEPGLEIVQVPLVLLDLQPTNGSVYGMAAKGCCPYVATDEEAQSLNERIQTWVSLKQEVRQLVGLESPPE